MEEALSPSDKKNQNNPKHNQNKNQAIKIGVLHSRFEYVHAAANLVEDFPKPLLLLLCTVEPVATWQRLADF